ncbi:GMC oxidoreductase [Sphingomonas sp. 37zxx]|uniref:GMC oxidoreductase n=1 Tax=Sphingomonas sp. 37zxx TaxID=1550073 RepID=UPI00068CADBB|nr:GMC family oxidoreductase [Sphingomonas sp. 37zxx]
MLKNIISAETAAAGSYDVILIGTGFGSSFFLKRLLEEQRPLKVLALEAGPYTPAAWQAEHEQNSYADYKATYSTESPKPWQFTWGFGGGTNCWFAQTPRFLPSDFRTKTLYGIGDDWPLDYAALEPYYQLAEDFMGISGPEDMATILPRSKPFPQPPHRFTAVDRLMKKAQPDRHFVMPTARARVATETRNACCASLRCGHCPANAKFNADNGVLPLYNDPRVSVCLEAPVTTIDHDASQVSGVRFSHGGKDYKAKADLIVLGANAIHAPAILLRSGMSDGPVGQGIHESYGARFEIMLDGVDNLDGSTITTGINYTPYIGDFRKDVGGSLLQFDNSWKGGLRAEPGRWRQKLNLIAVTEDLWEAENHVTADPLDPRKAIVHYKGPSDYAVKGMDRLRATLPQILSPLPVERIDFQGIRDTEAHLQGTLKMGSAKATSVADAWSAHHRWRNLIITGTSTFPTCSCANPSLTAAALSIRAADKLYRSTAI